MRLTTRGKIVVWLLTMMLAILLGAFSSNYCWAPDGSLDRCDRIAAQMAWVSDAATELP